MMAVLKDHAARRRKSSGRNEATSFEHETNGRSLVLPQPSTSSLNARWHVVQIWTSLLWRSPDCRYAGGSVPSP
jgi:hypothetical protein